MLTTPIVEGAWYKLVHNFSAGEALKLPDGSFAICGYRYHSDAKPFLGSPSEILRVYLVPTDPAEVVAELRGRAVWYETAFEDALAEVLDQAADLVSEKLGFQDP